MSSMQILKSDFVSSCSSENFNSHHHSGIRLHPFIKTNAYPDSYQSIYYAPCYWLKGSELMERVYSLFQRVKDDVVQLLDSNTVLFIVLPSQKSARSVVINTDFWLQQFSDLSLPYADCLFMYMEQGVCEQLTILLEDRDISRLLIISIDCLVTLETINELIEQQCIMTSQHTEGYVPGEGIAWALLEKTEEPGCKKLVINTCKDSGDLLPLTKAVKSHEMHQFIHLYHHKPELIEEWHQVSQLAGLHQRQGMSTPILAIEKFIGDCGAAMMVIGLAIMHQYAKSNPEKKVSLCELSPYIARGVISL